MVIASSETLHVSCNLSTFLFERSISILILHQGIGKATTAIWLTNFKQCMQWNEMPPEFFYEININLYYSNNKLQQWTEIKGPVDSFYNNMVYSINSKQP